MPDKGLLALAPSPQQQMGSASSKNSNKSGFNFRRAFAGRRKHSEDILNSPPLATSASYPLCTFSTPQNNVVPPPPPPKLQQSTLPPVSSENTIHLLRPHVPPPLIAAHSAQPHLQSAPAATINRASIIPLSPGIESAVNYMAMSDQMDITPTSASISTTSVKRQIPQQKSDSDASRQRLIAETEVGVDNASKRKSDSTISQCTIRPVTGSKSRPVSVADSFQSSYTIVPGNASVAMVVNKRFSTVDVLEEDDDADALSFKSLDDPVQEKEEEPTQLPQPQPQPQSQPHPSPSSSSNLSSSPIPSLAKQKRRSMSLNIGGTTSKMHHHALVQKPPPSASATDLKHPSYTISEGLYTTHSSSSSNLLATSNSSSSISGSHGWPMSGLHPSRNHTLPPVPFVSSSTSNSFSPAQVSSPARHQQQFTYPTQRPLPNHPAPPHSFRQTAVSFTSSLAPAAGLARKAVEKMKGALGHMGSGPGIGSTSSASISSHSSSLSTTSISTGPSSYQGMGTGYGLVRTSSNQSSAAQSTYSHLQMHSVNIKEIKEREKEERKREKRNNKRQRRTPNTSSGGTYSIASISTNESDSDGFMMGSSPLLGTVLRGPVMNRHGVAIAGGVVFGRELQNCVRETGVKVARPQNQNPNCDHIQRREKEKELMGRPELKVYEERMLPALVVRCAQHLLIWGIQEEGLFRVPGRAAHVAKLRSEFDTGMDYDLSGCSPGDLDPHAVASIFKAYLRELPEHILTNKLSPYFDAAIGQESTVAAADQNSTSNMMGGNRTRSGIGLPMSQKPLPNINNTSNSSNFNFPLSSNHSLNSQPQPQLRKPPSLSTLAMPSFAFSRPASKHLLSALRTLISKLPKENQDLLRTVVELIRATANESKLTKMPLSNLLMVFLPSLNVGAGLLKVFCEEEEGVWSGYLSNEKERGREYDHGHGHGQDEVVDVKRDAGVLDIKRLDGDFNRESEDEDEDDEQDDEQRRWTIVDRYGHGRQDFMEGEVVNRDERVQTVYLDSRSEASSVSVATSSHASTSASASISMSSSSVSAHSNSTRETSLNTEESILSNSLLMRDDSASLSFSSNDGNSNYLPSEEYVYEKDQDDGVLSSEVESVLTPTTSSQASLPNLPVSMDMVKDLNGDDEAYLGFIRPVTPSRMPMTVQFPTVRVTSPLQPQIQQPQQSQHSYTTHNSPSQHLPSTPLSPKRRSIPALTLAGLAALSGTNREKEKENWEEPSSPGGLNPWSSATSPSSPSGGPRLRKKRPSLRLLFSKKSTSSLNGTGSGYGVPGTPGTPGTPGSGMSLIIPPYSGIGRSDSSSVSTPLSAVTAHSLSLSGSGSGDGSSTAEMPPVLDTPIEEGKSFRSELGLDESPPGTSASAEYQIKSKEEEEKERKRREKKERIKTLVGQTPIADWYLTASAASSMADIQDLSVPPVPTLPMPTMQHLEPPVPLQEGGVIRRPVIGRGAIRKDRLTSTLSMNHLGLNDEQLLSLDGEDWTRTVLLAADLEPGVKTGTGGSGNRRK